MVNSLYVIPGSHACRAAILMLEHKGIEFRRVDLPTGFQPLILRARGFGGGTVPALTIGDRRAQTNHEIARLLDELQPRPPLFPAESREPVEEAETFADRVLQTAARRLILAAGGRDIGSLADAAGSGRLGPLLHRKRRARARITWMGTHMPRFGITPETEALDLAAVPALLDRVDAWIEAGVLDGPELNAADFQIVPSLCLLSYRPELRPELEARPAWDLVERVIPDRPAAGVSAAPGQVAA